MTEPNTWNAYGEELERRLRLKTFPLAIKLLEKKEDIPEDAQRPLRDFGYHLMLCQGFQLSRRDGATMAMLAEDMWCHEPVIGYGIQEPPDYFFEGHTRYPRDVATLEAGHNYAREFPRLEAGKCIGVMSAPLKTANFEPDLILVYCDAAQLSLLLLGKEWKDGYGLKLELSSHAACVYAVVPAVKTGECMAAIPCRGDHYGAIAGDDEMIFTIPREKFEDLLAGLRYVDKTGSHLPRGYRFLPEHPQADEYERIAQIMGYRGKKPQKPDTVVDF